MLRGIDRVDLRREPELVALLLLLLVGAGIVLAFTGRGEPPRFVIWVILGWLIALVAALGAYSRALSKREEGREQSS